MLHKIFHGILIAIIVIGIFLVMSEFRFSRNAYSYLAGIFFAERVSPAVIHNEYASSTLKVLIVPGHENDYGGAEFGAVKERDLTETLGRYIMQEIAADSHIIATSTRDETGGFAGWLKGYVAKNNVNINVFHKQALAMTDYGEATGQFTRTSVVDHSEATPRTAFLLYAINKYANENNINLVLHLHFNDYPGRKNLARGKYSGYAVYVPESQLPNARASNEIGTAIAGRLAFVEPASNYKKESPGLIEDQELIAVGSNGTRDGASVLIEFGYIYEKKFTDPQLREKSLRELAHATYLGLKDYLAAPGSLSLAE